MKTGLFIRCALAAGLALPLTAKATVSIEFQLGGIEVPTGSIGVLVADTADNEFTVPASAPGAVLSVGSKIGADDVIIAVLTQSNLPDWGALKGFANHFATIDYEALGIAEGQDLILHVFPDRDPGDVIRTGEPHLSYRTGDLGQLTANSSMGFALPRDGGAYLLAALGSDQSGTADLSAVDLTALPYATGNGNFNRNLGSTSARHTYFFQVGAPGFLSLEGTGGNGLRAQLYGPDGQLIAESMGGISISEELPAAGFHRLVVSREGAGGALPYGLEFSNAVRTVIPDLAVGTLLSRLVGNQVLNGASGQTVGLNSRRAGPVSGYATVLNRGQRPDMLAVRGSAGNPFCGITYFEGAANVTTKLIGGTYRTAEIEAGDPAVTLRVQFTPSKKKLIRKKGRKTVVLKRTFSTALRASSTVGPLAADSATIQAKTQ